MKKAGIAPLSTAFPLPAPGGCRYHIPCGEIFLKRAEESVLPADIRNGKSIENEGKFIFVPSDGIMSDHDIKSLKKSMSLI